MNSFSGRESANLTTSLHMIATQCARLGSAASLAASSQNCLHHLIRCLPSPVRLQMARSGSQAARGIKSAAGPLEQQQQLQHTPQQHQQHAGLSQQADISVQETVKLLEAGIGPLSTQPMVRPSAADPSTPSTQLGGLTTWECWSIRM